MAKYYPKIDIEVRNAFQDEIRAYAGRILAATPEKFNGIVDEYGTQGMGGAGDRMAASVTLRHVTALANEAKNGTLIKAAAAQGLDVKRRR